MKLLRRWSSLVEDDDNDVIGVSCEYCDANYELDLFRTSQCNIEDSLSDFRTSD